MKRLMTREAKMHLSTRKRLSEYYDSSIRELEQYLGKSLPSWYDQNIDIVSPRAVTKD